MKTTVSRYDFEQAVKQADRMDNFSYQGLGILFDYLEDYEDQTGEEIELDVIALCCDYSEDTWQSVAASYGIDTDDMSTEEAIGAVRDYLEDNTQLVGEVSGGFVYACF